VRGVSVCREAQAEAVLLAGEHAVTAFAAPAAPSC
jgi:hypothetical protein